jgi:segregation and condensation protein A
VFREILERAKKRPQIHVRREQISVREMLEHVKQVMRGRSGPVSIEDLAEGYVWRQALIALLLALLELVRLRAIHLRQDDLFAPITAMKSKRFEEIVDSVNAADLEESLGEI